MQWGAVPADWPAAAESRYLPQDPDPSRPTVARQLDDDGSLLRFVRAAIALRRDDPRLGARAPVEVRGTGYPFVYRRGSLLVALNPSATPRDVVTGGQAELRLAYRAAVAGDRIRLDAFGCAVVDLDPPPAAPAASLPAERNTP
jgi:maltose alpha-D-glucosyltransferase/alpha-amylase